MKHLHIVFLKLTFLLLQDERKEYTVLYAGMDTDNGKLVQLANYSRDNNLAGILSPREKSFCGMLVTKYLL